MKKLIVFVLIFAMLAVGTTAVFIKLTNDNIIQKDYNITKEMKNDNGAEIVNYKEDSNSANNGSDEKTIDLYGTYSENDLIIEKVSQSVKGYEKQVDIPQISGLKNKNIENKINNNIKNTINSEIQKLAQNGILNTQYSINANFSNVLSIRFDIDYATTGYEKKYISFNYNLIDGEELKFEDLFKKDEDLKSILRMIIYKAMLKEQRDIKFYDGEGFYDEYYDNEKGAWYAKYCWIDERGNTKEEIREYVIPVTEYDIEKLSNKFLKSSEKEFVFTPSHLGIYINNKYYDIELKEIADKVVIYNKYLTEESLYERSDIGAKSVITCSAETKGKISGQLGQYKESKYESNNFFYDVNLIEKYSESYPNNEFKKQKADEIMKKLQERVIEYKNKAANNSDKAYFLFLEAENSNGYFTNRRINPEKRIL